MGKEKELDLDDQIDSDEELLNFDLDDLSLSKEAGDELETEEEIIELTDLVERGVSEDITQDLKIRTWAAEAKKEQGLKQGGIPVEGAPGMEAGEKDAELDLSDISLEPDEGALQEEEGGVLSEEEITDADLEGLLQEEDGITLDLTEEQPAIKTGSRDEFSDVDLEGLFQEEDGITLDLTEEEGTVQAGVKDEISDADLEALLSETADQELEAEEEEESLVMPDEEPAPAERVGSDETQVLDLRPGPEESLIAEEPIVLLEKEAEELGAAAALEEGEIGLKHTSFGEPEPREEAQTLEEAEAAEEMGRDTEEGGEEDSERAAFAGISEERIEEIITKVVREVVERVAQETMAVVAERMIGEAIEALKQSIESSES
jgi:hypothetical protein